MTVVEVAGKGSCTIRNMETKNGEVNIIRRYYVYEEGEIKLSSEDIYWAESWEYTAYRVQPLDETYRELNRKF